jgi:hypothetical protein
LIWVNVSRARGPIIPFETPETLGVAMTSQQEHPSVLALALQWCRNRMGSRIAPPRPEPNMAAAPAPAAPSEMPAVAVHVLNGGLLFRCMELLQIDRTELANEDPLLFHELQGRCALCRDRPECMRALAHGFDDARWDRWREYCPNSSTLTTIGAVQNCARAAQHIKMPRAIVAADRG